MTDSPEAVYACETCGVRYTTRVFGGLAREELGEGRRLGNSPGELVPTRSTTCAADGGRFKLVGPDEQEGGSPAE